MKDDFVSREFRRVRDKASAELIEAIDGEWRPGVEINKRANLAPQIGHWHLGRLANAGVIDRQYKKAKSGGLRAYYRLKGSGK